MGQCAAAGVAADQQFLGAGEQRQLDRRHQLRPQLRVVVLERGEPGVALEQQAPVGVAQQVAGRLRAVADDRPRRRQHAFAARPEPPPEVDVLQVGEVALVEAAGLQEGVAARDHVAAAGEQQFRAFGRHVHFRQRPAVVELEGVAVEGHDAAAEVQALALPVDDAAGQGGHVRGRGAQSRDELGQPVRPRPRVVVDQRQGVGRTALREPVVRGGEPEVDRVLDDLHAGMLGAHPGRRPVRRPVVEQPDPHRGAGVALRFERRQQRLQVPAAVPAHDQDVDAVDPRATAVCSRGAGDPPAHDRPAGSAPASRVRIQRRRRKTGSSAGAAVPGRKANSALVGSVRGDERKAASGASARSQE